ncbi:hypothetical protein [Arthrobacter sp. UM1]|uniref:hypothetical protein n=1 Tax=Arthrobacter sp. UM1 TaxID=2766776 RepID=UPI001CF68D39|nr:hypothetical protein [Arthrobacter sp. UM1]MCB4207839.1 hypothetical protein [Arthrobacter sp. UM1]
MNFSVARRLLMGVAAVSAVLGLVAVVVVTVMGLMHQHVPHGLVMPFLILLPVALVAVVLTVVLGAVQRRLT